MTNPLMSRVAYFDPTGTGKYMTITFPAGVAGFETMPPDGVLMRLDGKEWGFTKGALPYIGRFFLAASVRLGVDPNEGWDKPIQEGGRAIF